MVRYSISGGGAWSELMVTAVAAPVALGASTSLHAAIGTACSIAEPSGDASAKLSLSSVADRPRSGVTARVVMSLAISIEARSSPGAKAKISCCELCTTVATLPLGARLANSTVG